MKQPIGRGAAGLSARFPWQANPIQKRAVGGPRPVSLDSPALLSVKAWPSSDQVHDVQSSATWHQLLRRCSRLAVPPVES